MLPSSVRLAGLVALVAMLSTFLWGLTMKRLDNDGLITGTRDPNESNEQKVIFHAPTNRKMVQQPRNDRQEQLGAAVGVAQPMQASRQQGVKRKARASGGRTPMVPFTWKSLKRLVNNASVCVIGYLVLIVGRWYLLHHRFISG